MTECYINTGFHTNKVKIGGFERELLQEMAMDVGDMGSPKIKILLIYARYSSFVEKDFNILTKHFQVEKFLWSGKRDIPSLIIKTAKSDLTFSWFAADHAALVVFLSLLFRKKSIVIAGGSDTANIPECGVGVFTNPLRGKIAAFSMKYADMVLTVDESLVDNIIKNTGLSGDNIKTVRLHFDASKWTPKGDKEMMVLTVGDLTKATICRKGFKTFIKAAEKIPETKFVIVGGFWDEAAQKLKSEAPPNVEFPGELQWGEELKRYYQKAKVFALLSIYEGLPNALGEAMLCECVPVGTKVCGIPYLIGDTGYYAPYGDVNATVEAIKKALNSNKGPLARNRIKTLLPPEKREKELLEIIDGLLKGSDNFKKEH